MKYRLFGRYVRLQNIQQFNFLREYIIADAGGKSTTEARRRFLSEIPSPELVEGEGSLSPSRMTKLTTNVLEGDRDLSPASRDRDFRKSLSPCPRVSVVGF